MGKKPSLDKGAKPLQHYCREHDLVCTATMVMPGRLMVFCCEKGCRLQRGATVLR